MIEAIFTPAHANAFEALLDQPLAGAFDHPATKRETQGFEIGILNMVLMLVKVVVEFFEGFAGSIGQIFQFESSGKVCQDIILLPMALQLQYLGFGAELRAG